MCINLPVKEHLIPEPDTVEGKYQSGEYEHIQIMKNDSASYEYIGYVCGSNDSQKYLIWSWKGHHEDGSIIGMEVYYTVDGKYIGYIQHDYSAGTSTSSHNSPYFVPGEPLNKK